MSPMSFKDTFMYAWQRVSAFIAMSRCTLYLRQSALSLIISLNDSCFCFRSSNWYRQVKRLNARIWSKSSKMIVLNWHPQFQSNQPALLSASEFELTPRLAAYRRKAIPTLGLRPPDVSYAQAKLIAGAHVH